MRERYVREWLAAQAASGYLAYDPDREAFTLPPEQAMVLADEDSPVYMLGGYHVISSACKDRARITERFHSGTGFGWHEHDPELFMGTERFFRPGYRAHLVSEWIPALDGVQEKLRAGGKAADIGCGHGVSTILHDLGDPVGALKHAREALADDGAVMLVEPFAADLHPFPARPGGRAGARSPGRGAATAGDRGAGRLQPLPARHRNPVQPGA